MKPLRSSHLETVMWAVLAALALLYAWHRYTYLDRHLSQLVADGYVITRVVGSNCVVVDATDRVGDRVQAYACSK